MKLLLARLFSCLFLLVSIGANAEVKLLGSYISGLHAVDNNWSFAYVPGGILAVNRKGGNGKTDFHVLEAASNFKTLQHYSTTLHHTDASWDFFYFSGGVAAVNRQGAAKTELHVLDRSTNYSTFLFQTPLPLDKSGPDWRFGRGEGAEIVCVATNGGQGTEAHIALGGNQGDYKVWKWQTPTAIAHATNVGWDVSLTTDGDLAAMNRSGAGGFVELHTLTRRGFYIPRKVSVSLGFKIASPTDKLIVEQIGANYQVFHLKTTGTMSGMTEIDVYETPAVPPPDPTAQRCNCVTRSGNLLSRSQLQGCTYFGCAEFCRGQAADGLIDTHNGVRPVCR
jgi:hypothetical protein